MTGFTAHLSDPELDRPLESVEDALNNVPDEPDTIERERLFMG
jgi:hypothetical protein